MFQLRSCNMVIASLVSICFLNSVGTFSVQVFMKLFKFINNANPCDMVSYTMVNSVNHVAIWFPFVPTLACSLGLSKAVSTPICAHHATWSSHHWSFLCSSFCVTILGAWKCHRQRSYSSSSCDFLPFYHFKSSALRSKNSFNLKYC